MGRLWASDCLWFSRVARLGTEATADRLARAEATVTCAAERAAPVVATRAGAPGGVEPSATQARPATTAARLVRPRAARPVRATTAARPARARRAEALAHKAEALAHKVEALAHKVEALAHKAEALGAVPRCSRSPSSLSATCPVRS